MIYLRKDDRLKNKDKKENPIEFYKCLQSNQFPNISRVFFCCFVSIFGTTYLCKHLLKLSM